MRRNIESNIEKPRRTSNDIGSYENQQCVCLSYSYGIYVYWITNVCELKWLCKSIVMPCRHFASESHRKATTKREKGKERNVVLFRLVSFPTRSRPVTSRWGFQLGYHRENNISRVSKKRIDCACTKDVKIVQNMNSILPIAKIQFSFLLINALNWKN